MRAYVSIPLAVLFASLAAFNVWIMLTGRGRTPRSRHIWTQIHRACGYTFITLFLIFCYFMLLRIRSADELPPRIALHLALALMLGPLLFAKVLVVRYQKSAWHVLMTLGITISAIAFTLVSMNLAFHYLRNVTPHKIPFTTSLPLIAVVLVTAVVLFLRRHSNEIKD